MIQIKKLDATSSSSSVTFSPLVKLVKIKNIGSYGVFINFNGSATTSHFRIDPGEELDFGLNNLETIHGICLSGQTSTLNIIGSEVE